MARTGSVPSLDNLTAALALFEVSEAAVRCFRDKPREDPTWDFTEALCDSPNTIVTDWRFAAGDALREVFLRLYPVGIKAMIEAEDEETLNPKTIFLQIDGIGSRYRMKIPKKPDLHEIVFSFRSILPDVVRIYALASYDGTDTYAHVVHSKDVWLQVETLLGPWFQSVFREHPVKQMFTKVGKDVKPKRDFLKKQVKSIDEWLARQRTFFDERYENDLQMLEKKLDSPYLTEHPGASTMQPQHQEKARQEWRAMATTPNRLLMLNFTSWGGRVGADGLRNLWGGDSQGWKKIRRSLEYFFWDVPVQLRFKSAKMYYFGCGEFSTKLALAIVLQQWEIAGYFCRQMLLVKSFGVAGRPLSRFLLKLFSLRDPSIFDGVEKPDASYGVYGSVFAAWNDPAKLAGALDVACDYHMMRIGDDHEFSWQPFYAFAAEILAIYRIRQELGLETPRIEHQLLDAPWRELPDRVPLERDAFLETLMKVIKEEVPDLLPR